MALQRRDYTYKFHDIGDHEVRFEIANEDMAGDPNYYGYVSEFGSWIIQKRTIATGVYTYCMGQSAYSAAWTGRAGLTYTTYDNL